MNLSPELISSFLDDLYEAAATPAHWKVFLERLRAHSGSSKAYFLLVDPEQRCNLSLQVGWDDSFAEVYARDWFQHDIVLDSFVAAQQRSGGDWIGDRESVIDDRTFLHSFIYNELIRKQGDEHLCAAALGAMPDGLEGGFAMRRASNAQAYEQNVVTLLAILAPHMKRALLIHRKLNGLQQANMVLASSVEAFDVPVLSMDSAGRVRSLSPGAREILAQTDGLRLQQGKLSAVLSAEDKRLQELIAGAVATGSGNAFLHTVSQSTMHAPQAGHAATRTPAFGGAMLISRREPAPPLQVVVMPFRSAHALLEDDPAALVFLSDPQRASLPRKDVARALYGLSPVEARLADYLVAGLDVKAASEHLRVTEQTARFYLKEVFRKAGVRSQAALVRLLLTLPGR